MHACADMTSLHTVFCLLHAIRSMAVRTYITRKSPRSTYSPSSKCRLRWRHSLLFCWQRALHNHCRAFFHPGQGRFSGRLASKEDEAALVEECRLLAPLVGGHDSDGEDLTSAWTLLLLIDLFSLISIKILFRYFPLTSHGAVVSQTSLAWGAIEGWEPVWCRV